MYLGIDIGGTKCAVVFADAEGNIKQKIAFPTTDCKSTVAAIIQAAAKMPRFCAIGISCGGPLDSERGIIMSPPNLPGWDNIPICDILRDKFGCPVYIENDANACALAEWRFGAARGFKNVVFLTFGTGLGAGLIIDGRLYRGTNGNAGEVGHIRLCEDGPVGYGKHGSFEGFCSGGGIAQLGRLAASEALRKGEACAYCQSENDIERISAKDVAKAAMAGDECALGVYLTSAKRLGQGLAILIDVLNPEVIVIGSIFQRAEGLLRDEMQKVIDAEALPFSNRACIIKAAELKDEIGDIAAISVAVNGYANDKRVD